MAEYSASVNDTADDLLEDMAPAHGPPGGGRSALALILAAILGPALLFAAFAWWSWNRVQDESTTEIRRTVDILSEQAIRLLRIEDLLLADVDSRLAGRSWPEIMVHEVELDAYLRSAAQDVPEVDGLYVVGPDGKVRLGNRSARVGPATAPSAPMNVDVSDRPFFEALKNGTPFVIQGPDKSRVTGAEIVSFARRLSSPDGSFRGIAVTAVTVDRMARSWKDVAPPGDAVALLNEDGTFLVRYPALPAPVRAPAAGMMPRLHQSESGVFDAAAQEFDGVSRRVGFRKLAPFPVYLSYAVDESNIIRQWYPVAGAFGLLTLAAALGLVSASTAVIRRARGEAEAHRQAESTALALRRSEESQRSVFRNAPAAMHSLDSNRLILDVNERWLELFGYDRDDVIGRPISDFYVLVDDAERDARWRDILERGGAQDEERLCIAKDGAVFYALVSVALEREPRGGFVRVITTVTDITARKRAEEAARGAETFAELLIENSIDGIIVKDRELRYTVFNRAMEGISGVPRSAVLGRRTAEVFPNLDLTALEKAWRDALEGRSTALQDQTFAFAEPGRSGYCDQTVSPLRDAQGAIIGALSIVRETTERHRMEEVLRQSQKMEAVGQLTGGIAHDFNNLLTVILGNIEALQRRVPPGSEVLRHAEAAAHGAERAATLTRRLLAFSRRQSLEPRPLDLNRLVAGVSDMLRRVLGETTTLETVLAGRLCRVFADANEIESALLNLAVNARDAMPEGGTLTIETSNARLDGTGAPGEEVKPGDYAMIAVRDTGVGMTQDVKVRAFEPFYTTKETGRGSGLGLSQVYGFARQSGGHVTIVSAPGAGTTIRLYLPRLAGEAAGVDGMVAQERLAAPTGRGRTVLVVEDDADVRTHSADALRELGYRVLEAGDGREALDVIERTDMLHLLFTDVGLPGGLDGRELAAEAQARRPGLKVLFTTGYAAMSVLRQDRSASIPHVIAKPFTYAALAAKVSDVLRGVVPAP
jgi:PAS domain S-box-containing protein